MRSLVPILVLTVLGGLSLAPASEAAQLPLTRAEICSISDTVIVGEVTDVETRWVEGTDGQIERLASLVHFQNAAGESTGDLTVTLAGGSMGELTHWVEDQPELKANQTYMLFLERFERGWRVVGGERGAIAIQTQISHGESLQRAMRTLKGCDDAK